MTGSGKTEVYLQTCADTLAQGGSVLVLCPEIGLTPQLLERFEQRLRRAHRRIAFGPHRHRTRARLATGGQRCGAHRDRHALGRVHADSRPAAHHRGRGARLLLQAAGWRLPLFGARPGVDARPLQKVPVVLGSATPSLESLRNVQLGRLTALQLPERAGSAVATEAGVDRSARARRAQGLRAQTLEAIRRHLEQGSQVLLFLNRRGYAPTLLCHGCGWVAPCDSCDARMTVHMRRGAGSTAITAAPTRRCPNAARAAGMKCIRWAPARARRGNAGRNVPRSSGRALRPRRAARARRAA